LGITTGGNSVSQLFDDTHPEAEKILIEGYRRMSPQEKLRRVEEMNRALRRLAFADVRRRYPDASPREWALRVASRWIEPELMRRAFGWDPDREGY
jgi:hypothetical protein